ncbi:MAG: fibronectin type III domain-containing protein [Coriobacteriales bacterium]|jgi:hypothetical protein|nr:fibronectin type III domain-containing protein [Coriobacteriales bacterium]
MHSHKSSAALKSYATTAVAVLVSLIMACNFMFLAKPKAAFADDSAPKDIAVTVTDAQPTTNVPITSSLKIGFAATDKATVWSDQETADQEKNKDSIITVAKGSVPANATYIYFSSVSKADYKTLKAGVYSTKLEVKINGNHLTDANAANAFGNCLDGQDQPGFNVQYPPSVIDQAATDCAAGKTTNYFPEHLSAPTSIAMSDIQNMAKHVLNIDTITSFGLTLTNATAKTFSYDMTYCDNSGVAYNPDKLSGAADSQTKLPSPRDLELKGKYFRGWATQSNSQTVVYHAGDLIDSVFKSYGDTSGFKNTKSWNAEPNDLSQTLYAVYVAKISLTVKPSTAYGLTQNLVIGTASNNQPASEDKDTAAASVPQILTGTTAADGSTTYQIWADEPYLTFAGIGTGTFGTGANDLKAGVYPTEFAMSATAIGDKTPTPATAAVADQIGSVYSAPSMQGANTIVTGWNTKVTPMLAAKGGAYTNQAKVPTYVDLSATQYGLANCYTSATITLTNYAPAVYSYGVSYLANDGSALAGAPAAQASQTALYNPGNKADGEVFNGWATEKGGAVKYAADSLPLIDSFFPNAGDERAFVVTKDSGLESATQTTGKDALVVPTALYAVYGAAPVPTPVLPTLKATDFVYDSTDTFNGKGQIANILAAPAGAAYSIYYQVPGDAAWTATKPVAAGRYNVAIDVTAPGYQPATKLFLGVYTMKVHTVSKVKLASAKKKLTVSWAKNAYTSAANASYYVVSYKVAGGKWKTVKVTSAKKVALKHLKSGKKYSVKVTAYKSVANGDLHAISATKKAKVK